MKAVDDPGGHRRAKAAHERAAETHDRAAALHEESANLHEEHAVEMREKGHPERVERAERIADHERELAEQERGRADKHRRSAQAEPLPEGRSRVNVRRARQDDATAIADVFIPSFESLSFLPKLHTHDEDREFVRGLVSRDEVWVAEENGQIVGTASLGEDVLDHLYVHPDFQGRGAGSALFEKAKERRPRGFTFWVFQQNDRARAFYEHRDCRLIRLTDGSGNDERTPDALYAWRPPGPAFARTP